MPDVKTVREDALAAIGNKPVEDGVLRRWQEGWRDCFKSIMDRYGDALVMPTFIVTQKGLEAGCRAQLGCEGAPPSLWDEMPDGEKEAWLFKLRLGIAAAGGIVADEVVVVDTFNGCAAWVFTPTPEDGPMPVRLRDGDKLYIVRAKEE